jgi:hypothetical protein
MYLFNFPINLASHCVANSIKILLSFFINIVLLFGIIIVVSNWEEKDFIYKNTINDQSNSITNLKEGLKFSNKERDYYKNRLDLILEAVRNGE